MRVDPGLLGCGQKNEQVDDAVLQGVKVLQGKGGDVWTGLDSHSQGSSLPLPPWNTKVIKAEVQCPWRPARWELY